MPEARPAEYRILSLNGGGVRGLFQASFLTRLERRIGPLRERFDMIAATSTGALVGAGLAAGLPAEELEKLYRENARRIFRPRRVAWVRRGARYRTDPLRSVLKEYLDDRQLGELPIDILICASALNRYEGKVFTRSDADVTLVDAALASAAAPTFFPPVVPAGYARGYIDGGLWANDPLPVAVAHANRALGIPTAAIEALSVGTGRVPRGCTPEEAASMRTLSLDTVRFLLETGGSLQDWSSRHYLDRLTEATVHRVNPELVDWVALDDASAALSELPALAESEYELHGDELAGWLTSERRVGVAPRPPLSPSLEAGIRTAQVSRFIPARKYYAKYRDDHDSISSYVSQATRTLTMVSINLATGGELERIERVFAELLGRGEVVQIRVSLLDHTDDALMKAIASIVDLPQDRVRERISDTEARLLAFRNGLDADQISHLELYRHHTIPSASAILIDVNTDRGRIQLETKPYKAPATASWALEVEAGSEFYETLRTAYHQLLDDASEV